MDCAEIIALWLLSWGIFIITVYSLINWTSRPASRSSWFFDRIVCAITNLISKIIKFIKMACGKMKENAFIQIILMSVVLIAIGFYILNIPLYACLVIPSVIILMIIIGWLSPSDIISNTIASISRDRELISLFINPLRILGVCFCLLGSVFAALDLVLLNDENFRGFSLIGFGLIFLSFSYTMLQIYNNEKFLDTVREITKSKGKKYTTIINIAKMEKILFLARFIFIVGCLVVLYSVHLLIESKINYPLTNLPNIQIALSIFFGSVDIFGIGIVFLITAGTFEIDAINIITKNQILSKLKFDYSHEHLQV